MTNPQPSATSTVEVKAAPATVYALITDLDAMSQIAEETARMRWSKGNAAAPGAVFKGTNRRGWRRWTTKCTVTDAEPGEQFAFNVSHAGVPVALGTDVNPGDFYIDPTPAVLDKRLRRR